jgi:hypothetical protein
VASSPPSFQLPVSWSRPLILAAVAVTLAARRSAARSGWCSSRRSRVPPGRTARGRIGSRRPPSCTWGARMGARPARHERRRGREQRARCWQSRWGLPWPFSWWILLFSGPIVCMWVGDGCIIRILYRKSSFNLCQSVN